MVLSWRRGRATERVERTEHRIFVGGLPWAAGDDDLRQAFSEFGAITFARVILDRETQRSRGFGFVTFETAESAARAIEQMDGKELSGRRITVRAAEARPGGRARDGGGPSRGPRQGGGNGRPQRPRGDGPRSGGPRPGGPRSGGPRSGGRPGPVRDGGGPDRSSARPRSDGDGRGRPSRGPHNADRRGGGGGGPYDNRPREGGTNPWDAGPGTRRGGKDVREAKRKRKGERRGPRGGDFEDGGEARRGEKKRRGRGARGGGRASDYEDFGHDDW